MRSIFLGSVLFFSFLVGLQVFLSYRDSAMLSYPLDDAFIHMAISRNLAQHGVWGITQFQFSSTSSSVLYTLILAGAFLIGGIKIWLPLLINYLVGIIILFHTSKIAAQHLTVRQGILWQTVFILVVPLAGMAVLGMEHTLQILFCVVFLYQTWQLWNGKKIKELNYFLIAMLAVATRYESAFLIGLTAAAWLFIFGNLKRAVLLLTAVAIPIVLFGWFAVSQGGFFFPNSLLAKSNFISGSLSVYFSLLAGKILSTGLLFSFLVLPLIYWLSFPSGAWKEIKNRPGHLILLLVAATSVSHFILASYGWLFRYEAYLVALVMVAVLFTWNDWKNLIANRSKLNYFVIGALGLIILFPFISRVQMISHTKRAAKNIADQQVQMARFVQEHFPTSGIAINDIGALSFYNDSIRIFDMEGLGTAEVIKQKKQFDSNFLKRYVAENNISIGIFYPHLYKGKIPASWEQVGTWELTDNFVTGGSVVGFYAIDSREKQKMVPAMKQHAEKLPVNVVSTIHEN